MWQLEYRQIKENPLGLGLLNSHANEASKRYHRNKKMADWKMEKFLHAMFNMLRDYNSFLSDDVVFIFIIENKYSPKQL